MLALRSVTNVHFRSVNDQHITAIATVVQDILLAVNAGLVGWYLYETSKMRKAAENQVAKSQELVEAGHRQVGASLKQAEAASRPAIVARSSGSTADGPTLENIGNGPALDVRWSLPNTLFRGIIPYMKPGTWERLPMESAKPMYEAGNVDNTPRIECTYRSISGWNYSSRSAFDLDTARFIATFTESEH